MLQQAVALASHKMPPPHRNKLLIFNGPFRVKMMWCLLILQAELPARHDS